MNNDYVIRYGCNEGDSNKDECWFRFDTTDPNHWKVVDFVICDEHMKQHSIDFIERVLDIAKEKKYLTPEEVVIWKNQVQYLGIIGR